ncbi:MAG: hypothetical protein AAB011_13750 [Candidatus Eisenbacteria bacterium]
MTDLPVRLEAGLSGRPPKNASAFLARTRPQLTAAWVRSCRRALKYLNDSANPIDANWIRLFNSMADRLGHPRVTAQTTDVRSSSVTFEAHVDARAERPVTDRQALAVLEQRLRLLQAAANAENGGG